MNIENTNTVTVAILPVVTLPVVTLPIDKNTMNQLMEDAKEDMTKICCHWCDQYGHYKRDCRDAEFFIEMDERRRNSLRYKKMVNNNNNNAA